jgi:hypothetical protein
MSAPAAGEIEQALPLIKTSWLPLVSISNDQRRPIAKANFGLAPVWWTVEGLGSGYLV